MQPHGFQSPVPELTTGTNLPWPSLVVLLYPLGAAGYIAATTPAGFAMVIGYGLANLGYLLVAAGIYSSSFRILHLKTRRQVFAVAIVVLVLGTVLSNVSA